MDSLPLVSIICLCYNQKPFVREAIQSVLAQKYSNIELIVVDDASNDGSQQEIREILANTNIKFIALEKNLGNCAAFNIGFRESKGQYLIDLAADDVLLPDRVACGVRDFQKANQQAGVHFSDAYLMNEDGNDIRTHYARDEKGQLITKVQEGDIYETLIARYFICPPTMIIKRIVLEQLNGYDESLHYEDFDFWIRSSRHFQYLFNEAPLVQKRILKHSHSSSQFAFRSKHILSTLKVCEKIFTLNKSKSEDLALSRRCRYEIRQCLRTLNWGLIPRYVRLMWRIMRRVGRSTQDAER
jgi:GT2 family glycosyltransferase